MPNPEPQVPPFFYFLFEPLLLATIIGGVVTAALVAAIVLAPRLGCGRGQLPTLAAVVGVLTIALLLLTVQIGSAASSAIPQ